MGVVNRRLMVVDYSVNGDSFSPGLPRPWNEALVAFQGFDLMPDGKRVVEIPSAEQKEPTHATLLMNFSDDLRRVAPVGK
jgi:hypothetical protein